MKNQQTFIRIHNQMLFGLIFLFSGCFQMSEIEGDPSAGLNGGFEVSSNGLPVNWFMYTPKTVPRSDFKIVLDNNNFKEGSQSLKFEIKNCRATGGWLSPGFTKEFLGQGYGKFKVSFWIMNDTSEFIMTFSGVTTKSGGDEISIRSNENMPEWTRFEERIEVLEGQWLRVNLNVFKPGNFWIDDLNIEQI